MGWRVGLYEQFELNSQTWRLRESQLSIVGTEMESRNHHNHFKTLTASGLRLAEVILGTAMNQLPAMMIGPQS